MSWIHIMATIVSVGLLVYLTAALLWPEKFS
jgi:K+-transporting ATPase KdpF subunit